MKKIRVRYAPSPTGHLHIGNARTALFNYLFAKHAHGTFILRTEDTDNRRNLVDGEKSQIEYLHWLGITWDEGPDIGGPYGPYRQSEKTSRYQYIISQLLKCGLAYKSYKTEKQLEQERASQIENHVSPHYVYEYDGMSMSEIKAYDRLMAKDHVPYAIRFRIPKNCTLDWDDLVKGHMSFNSSMIGGDFVIQKKMERLPIILLWWLMIMICTYLTSYAGMIMFQILQSKLLFIMHWDGHNQPLGICR